MIKYTSVFLSVVAIGMILFNTNKVFAEQIVVDEPTLDISDESRKYSIEVRDNKSVYSNVQSEAVGSYKKTLPDRVKQTHESDNKGVVIPTHESSNTILRNISQQHKDDKARIIEKPQQTVMPPIVKKEEKPIKSAIKSTGTFSKIKHYLSKIDLKNTIAILTLGFGVLMLSILVARSFKNKRDYFDMKKPIDIKTNEAKYETDSVKEALNIIAKKEPVYKPAQRRMEFASKSSERPAPHKKRKPIKENPPPLTFHKVIHERIQKVKQDQNKEEVLSHEKEEQLIGSLDETRIQPIEEIIAYPTKEEKPSVSKKIERYVPDVPEKYRRVYELAKLGHSVEDIAQKTGFGIGEIEVVLNLHLHDMQKIG